MVHYTFVHLPKRLICYYPISSLIFVPSDKEVSYRCCRSGSKCKEVGCKIIPHRSCIESYTRRLIHITEGESPILSSQN